MHTRRTIGFIVLTCVMGGIAATVGLTVWLGPWHALGVVAVVGLAYVLAFGPWQRRWGATHEESRRAMPGDDLLRPAAPSTTRAITIDAAPEQGFGPIVRAIEPGASIVSAGESDSWCLLVEPTGDGRTRLISRWRQDWPRSLATRVWIAVADPGAFIMERKMLLRIRDLAERGRAATV